MKDWRVRKELGEKAGVNFRNIEAWEQGRNGMSLECADKIFKALGVSVTIGALKGGESDG